MQQALLGKRPVLQGHWLSALYGTQAIPFDNEGVNYTLSELGERKRVLLFQKKHVALELENIENCIGWLEKEERCCLIMKEGREDSGECEEREEDVAAESEMKRKKRRKRKKLKGKILKKEAEEDEEAEEVEAEEVEEEVEEAWQRLDQELQYAWQWLRQDGDACGIPKQYTPCKHFTNGRFCCQVEGCEFSHNEEVFGRKEFTKLLNNNVIGQKGERCETFAAGSHPRRKRRKKHRRSS